MPQGHKGRKKIEINSLAFCASVSPLQSTFEAQYPNYHWTYGNCQLRLLCATHSFKPPNSQTYIATALKVEGIAQLTESHYDEVKKMGNHQYKLYIQAV